MNTHNQGEVNSFASCSLNPFLILSFDIVDLIIVLNATEAKVSEEGASLQGSASTQGHRARLNQVASQGAAPASNSRLLPRAA